jgi:hypothetical protein
MIVKRYAAGQLDTYEVPAAEYDARLARLVEAERLLHNLYWHDWTPETEAEVRRFFAIPDDGPLPPPRVRG